MRYPNLDGLRGFLALSVIFSHTDCNRTLIAYGQWQSTSYFLEGMGSLPVCMFFMITGMLFWQKACSSAFDTRVFLAHRFRRIAPAYYLAAFLVVMASVYWSSEVILDHPGSFLFDLLKVSASGFAGSFPINGDMRITRLNGVWRTLAYEWKFYLMVPLLAFFVARHMWRKFAFFIVVLVIAITFPEQGVYAFLFEMGAVAVELSHSVRICSVMRSSIAAVATIVIAGLLYRTHGYTLWGTAPLFPLFLAVACGNSFLGILTNRPMAYLGTISYSIYLMHMPIVYLVMHAAEGVLWSSRTMAEGQMWAAGIFTSVVTICVSTLTYRYIEFPFINQTAISSVTPPSTITRSTTPDAASPSAVQ